MDASLLDAIGHTPLVRLSRLERDLPGIEPHGKLEASNPGGSVKDRAARHMVLEGLRAGALGPGKRLLDATSSTTGVAYAMIGAALGFPVTLSLPSSARPERKGILTADGAELAGRVTHFVGALAHARAALATRDALVMVVVLCDAADRYLSEHFWAEGGAAVAGAVPATRDARS
ncbi:MAG: pyridoxal-phosphate dependent enzyme [Acidobacteria bacterium]|nr:pyridoxal-phosphate dependent enzyme [Acidobacteriota bacterium]